MVDACELIIHVVAGAQGKPRAVHAARFPDCRTTRAGSPPMSWCEPTTAIRFEQRPYELPFFKPDFVTKDNLEVAW